MPPLLREAGGWSRRVVYTMSRRVGMYEPDQRPHRCAGNFFDARWAPHRFGSLRPAYYLDAPDFNDESVYGEIVAAYDQVVAAAKRLIELAVGRRVQMSSAVHYNGPDDFDGFHAAVEWED